MPGTDTLTWSEFSDWTGGLWERRSDREVPQNGLLEATDCYPQQRGGLAAFMRMQPVSQDGLLTAGVTEALVLGIWKLRPPFPQGRLRAAVLELNAGGTGIHTFRIKSMQVGGDATSTPGAEIATGTWNTDHTTSDVTAIDPSIQMVAYRDSSVGYRVWFNLPVGQTTAAPSTASTRYTTAGVYRMGSATATDTFSSGSSQRITSTHLGLTTADALWYGALASHQARLLVTATFNQLHNRIYMTGQGGSSGTTDFLDPLGEKAGAITWMLPSQSDYLLSAKSQTGLVVCQGDMRNPYNRQVSFSHNYLQSWPCQTDAGAFYMVKDDACYLASQGGAQSCTPNFYGTPMNPGIYPADFTIANSDNQKLATPTLAGDFLFAGNGYVMDMRTNAWFKSSYIPAAKHHTTDESFFNVFSCENKVLTADAQLLNYGYYLENTDASADTWNPAPSYSFTLPLIYSPHEDTEVREIVYEVDAFKPGSTVRVEVFTNKSEDAVFDKVYTCDGTGPQPVRCSGLSAKGRWVKIRTTVSSDTKLPAPNEAPLLERMFVGTTPQTRTPKAARKP